MDEPLLTAAGYLQAMRADVTLAADVVLAFDVSVVPRMRGGGWRARLPSTRLERSSPTRPFRAVASLTQGVDLVVTSPGRPVAAVTLELLAAMGVRRVVSVGTAAALTPMAAGSWALVTEAIAAGQLLDYPSTANRPSADLARHLAAALPVIPVISWTTDVPFRQSGAALAAARERAQVLEMECSALLQVGDALDLEIASLIVVSDQYETSSWRPGEHLVVERELRSLTERTAEALGASR